jgi:hypothetical protein
VDINCNSDNSEEFKVTLSSKVQEDTYQINELILKFLGYGKNETSSAFPLDDHWTSSYLGYRKITMPIKSFVDNTTPGW